MVSLEQRQVLAGQAGADPHLAAFHAFLAGQAQAALPHGRGGLREELLSAIASQDRNRFMNAATEIGQRRISPESDWCQDDYLLFLLLLGNEKFGRPLSFLSSIIEARRQNP